MAFRRRGMGATCAELAYSLPGGILCSTQPNGEALLTRVGATPTVVTVGPTGKNTLEWTDSSGQTPEDWGVPASVYSTVSSMPGWVIPLGIGVLGFALFMGGRR